MLELQLLLRRPRQEAHKFKVNSVRSCLKIKKELGRQPWVQSSELENSHTHTPTKIISQVQMASARLSAQGPTRPKPRSEQGCILTDSSFKLSLDSVTA